MDRILSKFSFSKLWLSVAVLMSVLMVACGAAAPVAEEKAPLDLAPQQIPAATAAPDKAAPAPAAAAKPTEVPAAVTSARDHAVVVTEAEPASVGAWSEGCSAEIHSLGCQDFVTDFLTWLDDRTSEIVPMSGVESWEQLGLDSWRFHIRPGVKFHNGAPFDGAAGAYGVSYNGIVDNPSAAISWTGKGVTAEAVDDLTFDVKCPRACPIFPRTGLFTDFQDPTWFEAADESERSRMTMGFGPYKIVDYVGGIHTKFEAYEDYVPTDNFFSQAPSIPNITHVYRAEATVRAAMVIAGEADWAADIGFDEQDRVPKSVTGKTAEVYLLVFDTVFHPELEKQKVRKALTHAVDCEALLESLFDGKLECHAAVSMMGTVGITEENSKPREYDPEMAKRLLKEAGYDPANEININSRPGSNIRGPEILESIVSSWQEIGVTSKLNSWGDLAKAREVQISGCGRFDVPEKYPDYEEKMDCGDRDPPGPYPHSSHAYEIATSNEILDMQRFNLSRLSCFSRSSRVCDADFEARKNAANEIPEGPERTQAMIDIADEAYEKVYFMPLFEVAYVYGLSPDLEWSPYYAPRLRGNTLSFSK